MPEPLTISCETCVMQRTPACADCVVTFLCDRDADDAIVIEVDELRSLRRLESAGLVPGLRHARR